MPGRLRGRMARRDSSSAVHPQRDGFHAEGEEEAILPGEELLARTPASADAHAATLRKSDGGTRARAIVQLQSEHGNAYVQRLVSTLIDKPGAGSPGERGAAPSVQRAPNAAPVTWSFRPDVRAYVGQWAPLIRQDLAEQMAQVQLATPGPFVTWEDLSGQKFVEAAMRPVMSAGADLWSILSETLAPVSPEPAINRGRDADDDGTGSNVYKPGVAQELRILYTRQLNASLSRILPRYLAAKEHAITAEFAQSSLAASSTASGSASSAATVLDPNTRQIFGLAPAPAAHEPSASDIAPSQPMDRHVIAALVSGVAVVDIDAYRKRSQADTATIPKRPRTVDFDFELVKGTLAWLRVRSPADPTAEDVAKTLYGDAALAYTVIAAPPLFAVNQQKVSQEHAQKLRALPRSDFVSGDPSGTMEPPDLTQAGPQYDQAAVNQARDLPLTTLDKDEIVQRMRMTLMHLDAMAPSAKTFGLDKRLLPVRAKIDARSKALQASTNPRDMLQWDAQSAEQSDLVIKAERGLRIAAEQYAAMTAPSETGRVESLPGYVERPLRSIAEAYIDAAANSDLVATAGTRLADADEKSTTYPVDVLEGALGSLRSVLMGAKTEEGKSGLGGDAAYDVSALQARESVLRTRLVNVRETLVANPTQAAKELKLIQAEVDDLQTEVSMVGYLDELAVLMGEVEKNLPHRDVLPDSKTDKAWQDLMLRLVQWHNRLDNIRREYRGGDKAKARQTLKVFLADGHFAGALQLVASDIVYREKVEQIDKLLSKLAVMVGVAIATMGVGLLVEGGMVGLGFSAAGFGSAAALGTTLVVSAAEAMSFTILSRQILESDSEHGSFILDFLMNWGLFTIMRSVGAGYKAFIGEEAAGTLIGKAGGLLVEFTSITATTLGIEYAKKKAAGQELTKAEARDIVLQSAAMFIGTAVGARLGEPLLKGIKLRSLKFGARVKTLNLERAQLRLKAEALEKSGNIKQAPDVLAKDANLLEQEQVLIKDVVRAALDPNAPSDEQLGPQELAELGELRKENKATLEGNARTRLMLRLEPRGGNTFLAPKGELNSEGGIADEYRALGDEVTPGPTDEVTHSESVSVKPSDGAEPITIVEKAGAAETKPEAADKTGAQAKFQALDDILTQDRTGFKDPDLNAAYQKYRQGKANPKSPQEWVRATRGPARAKLEALLGPDLVQSGKGKAGAGDPVIDEESYIDNPGADEDAALDDTAAEVQLLFDEIQEPTSGETEGAALAAQPDVETRLSESSASFSQKQFESLIDSTKASAKAKAAAKKFVAEKIAAAKKATKGDQIFDLITEAQAEVNRLLKGRKAVIEWRRQSQTHHGQEVHEQPGTFPKEFRSRVRIPERWKPEIEKWAKTLATLPKTEQVRLRRKLGTLMRDSISEEKMDMPTREGGTRNKDVLDEVDMLVTTAELHSEHHQRD